MTVNEFFDLFLIELEQHDKLREYYRYQETPSKFNFRKAYFCQRLQYVYDQVSSQGAGFRGEETGEKSQGTESTKSGTNNQQPKIWDVGSGYSTTQIFLALNEIASQGSTLEFYTKHLPQRFEYWSEYGDMDLVSVSHENIFDAEVAKESKDIIIVQDTLHHLEPLRDSLSIFYNALRPNGHLIAVEENGNNILQRIKLYRQRGSNRIIEYYDEELGRNVLMGNENIRPFKVWKDEFEKVGFKMDDSQTHYVRLFPPSFFEKKPIGEVVEREQRIWKSNSFLKEYFFFGVNFVAIKN